MLATDDMGLRVFVCGLWRGEGASESESESARVFVHGAETFSWETDAFVY